MFSSVAPPGREWHGRAGVRGRGTLRAAVLLIVLPIVGVRPAFSESPADKPPTDAARPKKTMRPTSTDFTEEMGPEMEPEMEPEMAKGKSRPPDAVAPPVAAPVRGVAALQPNREARIETAVAAIDAALERSWREAGIRPAEPATDSQYLRRICIDLVGRIPRASEAREFLADNAPDRRRRLVERLLASREHAEYMASIWHRFLVPDSQGTTGLEPWLAGKFAADAPYDQIVREIIAAKVGGGSGPADFFRILGNKPEDVTAATSRTFLGTQIQCAQCHKHPYDNWTQEDFWGHAAFFASLVPAEPNAASAGEDLNRTINHPKTGAVVRPRYLGGDEAPAGGNRRQQLAAWLTSADNPFFARAAANRTWGMMFGAGIIDPVDDMGSHNAPSHPEVLDELARFFAAGWSNRDLFRVLSRTRAYGLSSGGRASRPGTRTFATMMIKPLNAQQLYNSLKVAYHASRPPLGTVAGQTTGGPDQQAFLDKFRAAPGQAGEYTFGIPQAITLMNSGMFDPLRAPFHSAVVAAKTDADRVEAMFLITLSRLPSDEERDRFGRYLADQTATVGRSLALVDIHWALINSAEFAFNH